MSNRSTSLVFTHQCSLLPAGAPLELYEVIADTNASFEIEPSGRLLKRDRFESTRWATPDFTGSFTASYIPKHSSTQEMFVLYVVCGVVNHMQPVNPTTPSPIVTSEWRWVLDQMLVDKLAVKLSNTYRGCINLIKDAERDPAFKTGDSKLDAMIGMALCRKELLPSKMARDALDLLEDYQLRAVSNWHKSVQIE